MLVLRAGHHHFHSSTDFIRALAAWNKTSKLDTPFLYFKESFMVFFPIWSFKLDINLKAANRIIIRFLI